MLDHAPDARDIAIPGWVKLGALGLGTILLGRLVPAGLEAIPILAGVLLMLTALIWGRVWVIALVSREGRAYMNRMIERRPLIRPDGPAVAPRPAAHVGAYKTSR
jgi:hypothetical protein